MDNRPLHLLDGRREAPDRKRVAIRNADGAARSIRAIATLEAPPIAEVRHERRLLAVVCKRLFGAGSEGDSAKGFSPPVVKPGEPAPTQVSSPHWQGRRSTVALSSFVWKTDSDLR
jgi:hypothetical protein